MRERPDPQSGTPADAAETSPPHLGVLLCCLQVSATLLLLWALVGAGCPPAARWAWARAAVWVLMLDVGIGWLAVGPVAGSILWGWSLVIVLWAWAAAGTLGWASEVTLLVAIGPVVHLLARHRHRRRLLLQEQLEERREEAAARQAALAQARQAAVGLRKRLERYEALQSVAEHLSTFRTVEALVRWIVDQCFALIGKSDVCLFFLVDARSQALSLAASQRGSPPVRIRAKRGDVIDQAVLRSRRPVLVDDAQKDFRFTMQEARERPFRAVIAAPLISGGRVLGVVRLDSRQLCAYVQDDLRFLDVLLELCATALANAQLMEETQRLAVTDSLTGLMLRRALLEHLEREVATAGRIGGVVSLLMIDIDHFKAYNDALGHAAGDLVLQRVAQLFTQYSPPTGLVARYGGEEFIVMLPGSDRAQARAIAETMRQAVAEQPLLLRRVPTQVRVSIGVAQYPADGLQHTDLLHAADTRLYQAKAQGRNRVCF